MPSKKTIARLEAQILRRAAHCLQFEVSDPRMGFITLTGVELSKDMAYATIRYSVLGDEAECSKTNHMLEQARGFVQRQVASILHTRTTPTLRWEYDPTIAASSHMDQILKDVQTRDEQIRSSNDGPESVPDEADAAD